MTARPSIIVNSHTPYAKELFSSIGETRALASSAMTAAAVRTADAIIVRSETKVTKELLDGSRVRFVGTVTIGTDHIDEPYLAEKGITCASAPGSNAQSVAEYVLSALLSLSTRHVVPLAGSSLGVVGCGNIGSKVAKIGELLGMNVLRCDPPLARLPGAAGFVPLDEALTADIVTLHVPLTRAGTDATYHMIDGRALDRMKRGAALINTSRGGVVDTAALSHALTSGRLGAAVLDVWEKEPAIDTGVLSQAFIGTPHIAGYSLDGKMNAVQMIYTALCHEWKIEPVHTVHEHAPAFTPQPIAVSGAGRTGTELLQRIVAQVYDIGTDDAALRAMIALPAAERPAYFTSLRSGYRVRREFSNYTVAAKGMAKEAEDLLRSLHFSVIPPRV